MVQEVSLSSQYDFVYYCNISRRIQIVAALMQTLLVYSESHNQSIVTQVFYLSMVGIYLWHTLRRWYYTIDGRYDLRQLYREPRYTLKIQYAIAIFTGVVMAFLIWNVIKLENAFIRTVFCLCSFASMTSSGALLAMEFYEVFHKAATAPKETKEN